MACRSNFASKFLAYPAAAVAVSTSAAQGILNGVALGAASSPLHSIIFAVGSFAGAVLQPISWLCLFIACRKRAWGRAAVAFLLGLACLTYATLSSLGFVSTSRTDATAARAKSGDGYSLAKSRAEAAVAELQVLAKTPRGSRKAEAAKAERREALERIVARATEALEGDAATGAADPASASLSAYASAVGLHWTADQIAPWITALTVLFFEICSGASMLVVSVLAIEGPAKKTLCADEQLNDETDAPEALDKRKGRRRVVLPEDVMDRIKGNGGALSGSLASIAEQIGAPSRTTAKRVLGELEAAGKIRYDASADGTSVALC